MRASGLAALCLLAVLVLGGAAASRDLDRDLFIRPEDQRIVGFAGIDGGRSTFVSTGWKQGLTGSLDRPGWVLLESGGFGITPERYRAGGLDLPATRLTTQSAALAGRQWAWPGIFASAFVGPELQHEQLTIAGQVLRFSKPRYGARAQGELWWNPSENTLVTGTAVVGTARGNVWARASAGARLLGSAFVGPEITTYATETYREIRIGAHLTGWSAGLVQGRLSGGWMMTDDGRPGTPYVGVAAWIRL